MKEILNLLRRDISSLLYHPFLPRKCHLYFLVFKATPFHSEEMIFLKIFMPVR